MDVGLVTVSAYASGFLGVQVDGYGKDAGIPLGELQAPLGLLARPLDPEKDNEGEPVPTKACAAVFAWEGGRLHVFPTVDPRLIPLLPPLGKGDSCLYGGTEAGVSVAWVNATTREVIIGDWHAAQAAALAQPIISYLDALEGLLATIAKTGTETAVGQFKTAQAATKAAIAALLTKVT